VRLFAAAAAASITASAFADTPQERMEADMRAGRPLLAHVVVALCDNDHQGIVPVPRALGDGTSPRTNLYWGALYGVKTFFSEKRGWRRVASVPAPDGVLERLVLSGEIRRGDKDHTVQVVADAWDGRRMKDAVTRFLEQASGRNIVGGTPHVVAFVGHNGLMDFEAPTLAPGEKEPARAAVVLACASRPYFTGALARAGAHPLLLTRGLMAPEAYTLEAAIRTWFATGDEAEVRAAAAAAYDRYQRCGPTAARRLFAAKE